MLNRQIGLFSGHVTLTRFIIRTISREYQIISAKSTQQEHRSPLCVKPRRQALGAQQLSSHESQCAAGDLFGALRCNPMLPADNAMQAVLSPTICYAAFTDSVGPHHISRRGAKQPTPASMAFSKLHGELHA